MYFGESRHPILRKPDPEKEQLAEQNALLKRLLRQQAEAAPRKRNTKRLWFAVGKGLAAVLIGAILVLGAIYLYAHSKPQPKITDPVPLNIRQSVSFNIYFPDPKKLPAGYTLNTGSFSTGSSAVVYKITHGTQSLVVTVQPKLSATDLQQFYKVHMPLTIPIKTSVGPAALGSLNNETVVSLPTNTNAWLLITAPLNTNQKEISQVIQSMTLAQ